MLHRAYSLEDMEGDVAPSKHPAHEIVSVDGRQMGPGGKLFQPVKAYANTTFLFSSKAKPLRIMAEYHEPYERLAANNVQHTILVFGSARSRNRRDWELNKARLEEAMKSATPEQMPKLQTEMERSRRTEWMCDAYVGLEELSKRLAAYGMSKVDASGRVPYMVATGGGPGMMEAANKGASDAGAPTIGMGISLPFENGLNEYVTKSLGWHFHYFMMRKFWMVLKTRAVVAAPGGFGTMDELFELLTLLQTGKIGRALAKHMPIVLFGKKFWDAVVNFEALAEMGVISEADSKRCLVTDDPEEAYAHVVAGLEAIEAQEAAELAAAAATPLP
jgi:hypothetical protein